MNPPAIRVGLFGFGRAGKAVAAILLNSKQTRLNWVIRKSGILQHRSVPEFLGVESDEPANIYCLERVRLGELLDKQPVDVLVDFSDALAIESYAALAAERKITVVSAISAYEPAQIAILRKLAAETPVLWSPNITIGINFLILAGKVLKRIAPYTDIAIIEEHFREKPEISGTARKIARSLGMDEDGIKSVRAGGIIGRHEILFGFPYQTVRLMHESISREAFGNGALFGCVNMRNKSPGLYSMEDLLTPFFMA